MADLSIIEWIVYGLAAYGGLIMITISMVRDMPVTKAKSAIRLFCAIPAMIASALLAPAGPNISILEKTSYTINGTSGVLLTNSTEISNFVLSGSIWYYFHWMIFAILFVFTVYQFMLIMVKPE